MGKIKEWWNRYAIPEFSSVLFSVFFATFVWYNTGNLILSAYVGSLVDTISYYGIIIYRDLRKRRNGLGRVGFRGFMADMRNLLVEFGPSEYLDTIAIRPFFLALVPAFIPIYPVAVLVGGLIANAIFYISTIFGYEFRKKAFEG